MKLDLKRILKNYGIVFAFFLVCAVLAWLSPVFLKWTNILNIIRQSSIYGIMAVGMTFVILTGGIDLSVGSILAFAGAVAAGLLKASAPLPLVIVVAIGIGALLGLVNGLVITIGRITPFVTTLGMMSIARSLTLIYCNGYPISGFGEEFRYIGGGDLFGIPLPIVVFLLTVVLAWVILAQTRLGRYTYAIGGNEETVRLSGIRTKLYKMAVYVVSGITCGFTALILTSRLNSAEPVAGTGYELDVIAAVVIGGTSLSGGRGGVWGTLVGALLIAVINDGMILLGISPYSQQLVKGLIIIGAVLLDRLREEPG
ncbi:MAG TPA: ribose ABC transporter permease [Anaeromyxobacteraceae bacterium]|nr:ribose ABC transporter permease [Anaeromyxobacteraceae bacterium]